MGFIKDIVVNILGGAAWDWIKDHSKSIGGAIMTSAIWGIWAWMSSLPLIIQTSLIIFAFFITWIGINLYSHRKDIIPLQLGEIGQILKPTSQVEFFPNRAALEEKYPRREILKDGNECCGYFLSGEGLFSWNTKSIRHMKRIILPKPNASYVLALQTMSDNQYLNASRQIRITTKTAKDHKVDIKWFDDFIGMGILFCNPDEPTAWVQIEISVPWVEADNKQAIRIEKVTHPEVFRKLYDAYNKMWDESCIPSPTEYTGEL